MLPGFPIMLNVPIGPVMVAGTDENGNYGFTSDASFVGVTFGSLSAQPLAGQNVVAIVSDNAGNGSLILQGDAVANLAGKSLFIDSLQLVLADAYAPPEYFSPNTVATWLTGTGPAFPSFTVGTFYNIRIE